MPDTTLQLGGFTFEEFEIPDEIAFPGEQALGVHKLIGGQKTVDAMGWFPGDITLSGRFRGQAALSRAQTLQALFKAPAQITLTWGGLSYQVVPKTFTPVYQRAYEIPYTLTLEVVSDQSSPVASAAGPNIDDQVDGDMTSANGFGSAVGDPTLTQALATVSSAISATPTFAGASTATLNTVTGPISAALAQTQALLDTNNATITGGPTFGNLSPGVSPSLLASNLTAQANAMLALANLTALQSVLTRMQINLQADGASGATAILAGGNLYTLAAQEYGDPSEWVTIAEANGLTDPSLSGVNTLRIPASPNGTGGVWTN